MAAKEKQGIFNKITSKLGVGAKIELIKEDADQQKKCITEIYREVLTDIIHLTQQIEEDIDAAREDLSESDLHALHSVLATSIKNTRKHYDAIIEFKNDKRPVSAKIYDVTYVANEVLQFIDDLIHKYRTKHPFLSESIASTREAFIAEYEHNLRDLLDLIENFLQYKKKEIPESFTKARQMLAAVQARFHGSAANDS